MLNGKNLYLRALEPEDIELLYKWENDTTIWNLSNTLVPFSKKVLKDYIDQAQQDIYATKQLRLMICLKDRAIGCVDLFDFDPSNLRAGIGILIADEQDRNQGYAAEAIDILKNYGKEKLNLNQLYCNIAADNSASFKLFKSKGFEQNGLKKNWQRKGFTFVDEYFLQCIL
jgi:diamine N-acetyltransferase